jgi:alanine dehydrogenase
MQKFSAFARTFACNRRIVHKNDAPRFRAARIALKGGKTMLVGVPKEIKNHEYRVGLIPGNVRQLAVHGHEVWVQKDAGAAIGLTDDLYRAAGARIIDTAQEIFAAADMIVKVKEPQPQECRMLRPGQTLFTYLHLAPDPEQTRMLQESGAVCIAYETVTDRHGGLPLLAPMSEVAGRMSIQAGAHCLEKSHGGIGLLLGGVPGTPPAKVAIIGGGVVGTNAARMAIGLEAYVTVLDKSLDRLRALDLQFGRRLNTVYANVETVEHAVLEADLVIGAVLVPGASAPKIVTRDMVSRMKKGAVLVDVSIDQGGCFETSRATTHAEPTYVVDGVIHYCVANMPGAVARTSTFALNNATAPFVLALADKGWQSALNDDAHLRHGLNVCKGQLTHPGIAHLGTVVSPESLLA